MGVILEASDIVELAMELESNGEAFYRAVARNSQAPQLQETFADLADQEVKHREVFAGLRETLRENPLMSSDEWDQYMAYLRATIWSAFFEGADKALAAATEATDAEDAVRLAIGFEKETLLFFYDLRDVVTAGARSAIDEVIAEEKRHLRRLATIL
jgi:rubrerythrin